MESDQELIELANKGDSDAFEALYRRYRDWVYRLAWDLRKKMPDFRRRLLTQGLPVLSYRFYDYLLYPVVRHVCFTIWKPVYNRRASP
jgi:hypothetical protein